MESAAKLHLSPDCKQARTDRDSSPPSEAQTDLTHALNNKLGVIMARCELLGSRSHLGAKASKDLLAIRNAAKELAVMISKIEFPTPEEGTKTEATTGREKQ